MSLFGRYGTRARTCITAMGLAAGLLAAAPAHAQSALPEPNTFDITPFVGFGTGFGDDALDPFNPSSSFLLGVAVGYNFTTNLSLEGELGIIPDINGDTNNVDLGITTFSANGVYHFDTQTKFVPYATFGIGFGSASLDIEGVDDEESNTASTATPASSFCSFSGMPSFSNVARISGSISSRLASSFFFFGAE